MLFKNSNLVFHGSKLLLIALFTYAATTKLLEHDQFVIQIGQVAFIKDFRGFLSIALPAVELLTALCLVFERTLVTGLVLATMLMTEFTLYVVGMLLFSSHLPCSCGGVISQMTWKEHFVFNLFFMLLSWNALVNYYKYSTELVSTNTKEVS